MHSTVGAMGPLVRDAFLANPLLKYPTVMFQVKDWLFLCLTAMQEYFVLIAQFQGIKILPETINITARLWEISSYKLYNLFSRASK